MCPAFPRLPVPSFALPLLAAVLSALPAPSRAEEDPLLGRIKVIQCVGCTPGSVDLIINDPIDVRDFQVRINESDYQKIITPLPGKTVYDKNGCFYWFEAPKAPAGAKAEPAKDKGAGKAAKTAVRKAPRGDASDSAAAESATPPPSPEIQGTPSRCVPFTRVEPKPAEPGKKKKKEED